MYNPASTTLGPYLQKRFFHSIAEYCVSLNSRRSAQSADRLSKPASKKCSATGAAHSAAEGDTAGVQGRSPPPSQRVYARQMACVCLFHSCFHLENLSNSLTHIFPHFAHSHSLNLLPHIPSLPHNPSIHSLIYSPQFIHSYIPSIPSLIFPHFTHSYSLNSLTHIP